MNPALFLLLGIVLGLFLGAVVGWLLKTSLAQREISSAHIRAEQALSDAQRSRDDARRADVEMEKALADTQRTREEAQKALEEFKTSQMQLSETLSAQFRNLATEILEERSKSFSQTSSDKIGGLLTPLQQQLENFRKRVDEVHESQTKSTTGLQQNLLNLAQLNSQLSDDARNLASALKGESQRRGAWSVGGNSSCRYPRKTASVPMQ